ncbi:alpha/beta fold hydrolase [Taibaiella koreensis]|uniref:alpha/beta fold hydrolase n=1 Tax=Taibaiella koreensis TaxID=1268548 RepID=UPI000E5A086C|nr:alpha/beta hydrolase [Taibaiella koreensis]
MKKWLLVFAVLLSFGASAQEGCYEVTATNLENIAYPFPVDRIHLVIQGEQLQMAFMDVQPRKPNGRTVLLLHGKNFCGAYWEQTVRDLLKEGYRVVIPDQIGFGKSSKPHRIQYSFQLLALNTKAILDRLHIGKAIVVGHSMGGMLAARFALMFPELVEQLVLENPLGLEDWKRVVSYQTVDDWYASELKQTYESLKQYQMDFYYNHEWKPEYDRWIEIPAGWTRNADYPRIAWNSALLYDMIFTQPVCYEWEQIQAPTLLIIGQKDRTALGKGRASRSVQESLGNYPRLGRETAKRIKHCRLKEIDDAGHAPHLSDYRQFRKALLGFLED